MSLNVWSIILFSAHVAFYLALMIALVAKSSVFKLVIVISAWILYQIATLWYGISTGQIGFILMAIFQFIITLATILISTERQISENF